MESERKFLQHAHKWASEIESFLSIALDEQSVGDRRGILNAIESASQRSTILTVQLLDAAKAIRKALRGGLG
jgi:hypothetical protein